MSRRICSVVDCANTSLKTNMIIPRVGYFAYPSKKYQPDRRHAWIRFAKRKNADGTDWLPKQNSVICGDHFIGLEPKNNPAHLDYVPSIRKKLLVDVNIEEVRKAKLARFNRSVKRKAIKQKLAEQKEKDASTQTDIEFNFGSLQNWSFNHINGTVAHTQVEHEILSFDKTIVVNDDPLGKSLTFRGFKSLKTEANFQSLAGVSKEVFDIFVRFLDGYHPHTLTVADHLLIFLMRIKLGCTFCSIATIFQIHRTTVSRIFFSVLEILAKRTKPLIKWPTRKQIEDHLPDCFKQDYPQTRVIIDCTEIKTETPGKLKKRNCMYSHYKGTHTCKFLIAVAPSGLITFLSESYGGRTSDPFITNDSGILNNLEENDIVMADKGFPKIEASFAQKNIFVVIPPRAKANQKQFTKDQMAKTKKIASIRIHVERSIQRVKTFNILNHRLPLCLVKHINEIMHVCCVLANFQAPIIKDYTDE